MERFANLTYIPFVGWMFPMAVKDTSEFVMSHARQGFIMAVFFTASVAGLYFLSMLIPSSLKVVRLVLVIMIYILYAGYFGLCAAGTYLVIKRKNYDFPVFKDFTGKLGF